MDHEPLLYEIELRSNVHIVRRTPKRAPVSELVIAIREVVAHLDAAPKARGIIIDSRAAPPTLEREAFDTQAVPLLVALVSSYEKRSVVVASHAAALHTRRAGSQAIEVYVNDMDAAIAYATT